MKTKKTKEAVSLIVLVLTIVIMIILAGVIIINLNNSGIIDRAKNAVNETNLKNMQELANVAWGEAYLELQGEKTPEAIKTLMLEKLKGKGVSEEELAKYTFTVTTGGVEVAVKTEDGTPEPEEPVDEIIPEGATYYVGVTSGDVNSYTGATATYTAGTRFPDSVSVGDVYVYNGYEYRYGYEFESDGSGYWVKNAAMEGWGVAYISDSETPQPILEAINGIPIVSLTSTFAFRDDITSAPLIPANVTDLSGTFVYCSSLHSLPEGFTIPSGVTDMGSMFEEAGLRSLPAGFTIPEGVTNICGMLMNNPISSLPAGFQVPKSVDDISYAFSSTNLSGSITIHATPRAYDGCFESTQISKILGDCQNKAALLATSSYDPTDTEYTGGVNPSGVIPEGSVYLRLNGDLPLWDESADYIYAMDEIEFFGENVTAYMPGENFPTPEFGDVFLCNGYRYVYEMSITGDSPNAWSNYSGWGVKYIGNESSPEPILESIAGKTIQSIAWAFCYANISTIPEIPATVKNMEGTFCDCTKLKGSVTINITPENYWGCFMGTGVTEILGTCTIKDELLATVGD